MACSKRINCSSSCPIRDLPPNFNCYDGHEIDVRRRRGLSRLGKRLKNKVRKYVFNKLNSPGHGQEGYGRPVEVPCTQCHAEAHQWYLGEVQQHAEAYHYASLNELKMIEADLEREINELYEINTNFNSGHEAFERKLEALSESMVKNREKTEATLQGVFQGLNSIWLKYKKTKTKNRQSKSRKNSSNVKETTSTQTVSTQFFNRSDNLYVRGENKQVYGTNQNQPDPLSPAGDGGHINARGRTIFTLRDNGNNANQVTPIWNQLSKSDKEALCPKNEHSAVRSTTSAVISTNHDTDSFQDLYRLKKGRPKIKSRAEVVKNEPEVKTQEKCSPTEEQDRGLLSLIKDRLKEAVGIVDEMNGFLEIINVDKQKGSDQDILKKKSNESEGSEETDRSTPRAVSKNATEKPVKKKKNKEKVQGTCEESQAQVKRAADKSGERNKGSESASDESDVDRISEGPVRRQEKNRKTVIDESDRSLSEKSGKLRKCQHKETIYKYDNEDKKSPRRKPSSQYLSRFDIEVKSGKGSTEWKINAGKEQVILHLKKDKKKHSLDQNLHGKGVVQKVLMEETSEEESVVSSFHSHVLRGQRTPVRKDKPLPKNYILNFIHEEESLKKHEAKRRGDNPRASRREKYPKENKTDRRPYFNKVHHDKEQEWNDANTVTLSPSSARKSRRSTSETGRTLRSSELKPKVAFASSSRGQTFVIEETFVNSSKTNSSDESYAIHGKRGQFELPSSTYDSMNGSEMYFKNAFVKSFSN